VYKQIDKCRICGNPELVKVLELGTQVLTGVFPRQRGADITAGPLNLVKCHGDGDVCGLLQLQHSYELSEMYGENYGYRSGLNASMVSHLHAKVRRIQEQVALHAGDLVVDIGSNDSTTLQAYPSNLTLVGIDPTGVKFREYYPPHIQLIPDFFSSALLAQRFVGSKARVVTSFSMFYDLEDPLGFMQQVRQVLADDGIWVFEQSYMPTMLSMNSYDTACHEHLEYYALAQIEWMCKRVGFRIVDVEFNDINGGSFSVTAAKTSNSTEPHPRVREAFDAERALGLHTLEPYRAFAQRVADCKRELQSFVREARAQGKTVAALGASTKGNVLLQYCGFTAADISMVGEVNAEKFGAYTPGTEIPIVPESELLARNPDYLLVLPWHFRRFFLQADKFKGRQLVFPLPRVEVITP
jgi:C-methyltransferase C-terminal domain/Putative zinc binding domain/Methyltransferase domain